MPELYNPTRLSGIVTSGALNANLEAIADAFEKCLARTTKTGNELEDDIDFNGYKAINLSPATNNSEAVTLGQVRNILTTEYNNFLQRVEEAAQLADDSADQISQLSSILQQANTTLSNAQQELNRVDTEVSRAGRQIRAEINQAIGEINSTVQSALFELESASNIKFYTYREDVPVNSLNEGQVVEIAFDSSYDSSRTRNLVENGELVLRFISQDSFKSLSLLKFASTTLRHSVNVVSFFEGLKQGGGLFVWDSSYRMQGIEQGQGILAIDPLAMDAIGPTIDDSNLDQFYTDQKNSTRTGAWVRVLDSMYLPCEAGGAIGDQLADDTAACHAVFEAAMYSKRKVQAIGEYRVTRGFSLEPYRNYVNLIIEGAQWQLVGQEAAGTQRPAQGFHVDNTNPDLDSNYFIYKNGRERIELKNVRISSEQFIEDRGGVVFGPDASGPYREDNVFWSGYDRPNVIKDGAYLQNSTWINVQWRGSGTIHSEANTDNPAGNVIYFRGCHHEGSTPINSGREVMNLSGMGTIRGELPLLEGNLPEDGTYAVFKMEGGQAGFENMQTSMQVSLNGFWSEWVGNKPRCDFSLTNYNMRVDMVKLEVFRGGGIELTGSRLHLNGGHNSPQGDTLSSVVQFNDEDSELILENWSLKNLNNLGDAVHPQIRHRSCSWRENEGDPVTRVPVNLDAPECWWRWNGGPIQNTLAVSFRGQSGTTVASIPDGTYGRQLRLSTPNAGIAPSAYLDVRVVGPQIKAQPMFVSMIVDVARGDSNSTHYTLFFEEFDGSNRRKIADIGYGTKQVIAPISARAIARRFKVSLEDTSGATDVNDETNIKAIALYSGSNIPSVLHTAYPAQVVSYASDIPSTNEYEPKEGDRVYNDSPSNGDSIGWAYDGEQWLSLGTFS